MASITMTLNELNILEQHLIGRVNDLYNEGGTIEVKTNRLAEDGIFKNYTQVHKQYITLINSDDISIKLQTLKRALYMQWIGSFEPSFITGITTSYEFFEVNEEGLELDDFHYVYEYLDKLLEENKIDDELKDMLTYYSSWDFLFDNDDFRIYPYLIKFVREHANTQMDLVLAIRKRDLTNRGQMGEYFLGLGV